MLSLACLVISYFSPASTYRKLNATPVTQKNEGKDTRLTACLDEWPSYDVSCR